MAEIAPERWASIDSLKLWERNYNQGDIGAIYASIRRFGFNNALRVWNDTVMAGNHSLIALRQLVNEGDWQPTGGSIRDNGHGVEVQVVDVSHLSRQEAEAFAIADNRTAELASHDDVALAALLQEFASDDLVLMEAAGYDGDDLDALLYQLNGEVIIPNDRAQIPPTLDYDHIIEIGCNANRFEMVMNCLAPLKGFQDVQINIS